MIPFLVEFERIREAVETPAKGVFLLTIYQQVLYKHRLWNEEDAVSPKTESLPLRQVVYNQ